MKKSENLLRVNQFTQELLSPLTQMRIVVESVLHLALKLVNLWVFLKSFHALVLGHALVLFVKEGYKLFLRSTIKVNFRIPKSLSDNLYQLTWTRKEKPHV